MMPGLPFVKKETGKIGTFTRRSCPDVPEKKLPNPRIDNVHFGMDAPIWTTQCYGLIIYYTSVICQ